MQNIIEDGFHNYFQQQIVWLFFQLTRKDDIKTNIYFEIHIKLFLKTLKGLMDSNSKEWIPYLELFMRCLVFCRDTFIGLGERDLFYHLVYILHHYFPRQANYIICCIIHPTEQRMIGCWRDLPYLCNYVYENSSLKDKHPIILFCIYLMNDQLDKDIYTWKYSQDCFNTYYISNICKHLPRENSKHDWLYTKLCTYWIHKHKPYILQTPKTLDSYNRALKKCKKLYRKNISYLHKNSDSFIIQMCKKDYTSILPHNISIDHFSHHRDFFLEFDATLKDKNNLQESYLSYMDNWMSGEKLKQQHYLHGHSHSAIPLGYLVKRAIYNIKVNAIENREIQFLNSYWKNFTQKKNKIDFFLPLLDVSNTLNNESFFASLAISLYVSQTSKISNCIVAMDKFPTWISIPDNCSFYQQVSIVLDSIHNLQNNKCNYKKAIQLIIHTLSETNVSDSFIRNMKLLILSEFNDSMILEKDIIEMFTIANFLYPPKIVYWNLSRNNMHDLPCDIHSQSSFVFSGYSKSQIHNVIYMNAKQTKSTYETVLSILNDTRYDFICDSFPSPA